MGPGAGTNGIFSATYSGVPVFEFNIDGNHVMRRRHDHYINATHILKVADYDKPARTRILEREVQKGKHEKVQGGYGKYQGTWVPLKDGRHLAERNGVLDKLRPIFDYVPGDVSPPQAPKHTTNSNKPRIPKPANVKKLPMNPVYSQMSEEYENISNQLHDDDSLDNSTVASASFMGDDDAYGTGLMHYGGPPSRKRKRGHESVIDQEHTFYADQLLDYFVLSASETPYGVAPPRIPDQFQIDRPIDDQHHTALHWGAAMGDLDIVGTFLDRGASPSVRNKRGETPLVRAVLFTNNYEKDTMPQLVHQLLHTLKLVDNHGATVLHHIAMTTNSLAKKKCAQYYLNVVLNKLADYESTHDFLHFINRQDRNGDTALHIVARHNAKKCVRALQGRSARGDIFNSVDETADLIMQKTRSLHHNFISSSPAPEANVTNRDAIVMASKPDGVNHYHSQSARSFSQSFGSMAQDKGLQMALAFESEVKEKDDDLTESQGVLTQIQNQQHQLRQGYLRHLAEDADGSNDNEEQMHREREWRLIKEISSFSEQIQHQDLHRVVRAEDNNVPMSIHEKSNGIASDASALEGQGRAAHALAAQQNKRKRLTTMVVTAQGAAGMSAYGEKLKKLVSITCAMPEDQVLESAPEILDILEQSKGEGARGVAVEG